MRNAIILVSTCLLLCVCAMAKDAQPTKELLKDYRGKEQLPDDLYTAYAAFVKAIETAEPGAIHKHCFPQAVKVTTEDRPRKNS